VYPEERQHVPPKCWHYRPGYMVIIPHKTVVIVKVTIMRSSITELGFEKRSFT
jgi:hypothetical protein